MRIYISIILLTASSFIYGQTAISIAGKVISEEGSLSNAYVMIGSQGSITNNEGEFKFHFQCQSIPSELKIEVSAVGYRTQEFTFSTDDTNFDDLLLTLNLFPNIDGTTALEDIKAGKIQFLLSSGIAPVIYGTDKKFTRKYGVSFYEFGCEAISEESLKKYNAIVAEYLDKKFGEKWRKEVRNDIIGIK